MDLHRIGRLSLLTGAALLLAACATSRGTLAGPRPRDVAVLVTSGVPLPQPQTAIDDLTGVEAPAAIVARESARAGARSITVAA